MVWYGKDVRLRVNLIHIVTARNTHKDIVAPHPFPGLNHAVSVKLLTSSCPSALSIVPPESKDCLKRNDPPCSPVTKRHSNIGFIFYFIRNSELCV